tara:strand:- start:39 stop:962 length:924 start_codon:yes stop_codon:yes gene_type:complete
MYFLKINFKIFKNIFFFISIFYFSYYLIFNKENISFEIKEEIFYSYIFLSFLFCILSIFFNGLAWKNIIIWFGQGLKNNNLVSFYILTNSLKYVPGGVWHFVERFTFLKERVNDKLAFCVNLIEPYFMLSASLLMTSLGVIYNPLFILFLLPSVFLHRDLIYLIIIKLQSFKNKSIKILKINYTRSQFDEKIKINSSFPFKVLSIEILFILFKFFGFILCVCIFNDYSSLDYIFIFTIFCLSWSLGLIIPAAPGGIGVFEGCFLFLIGDDYSQSSLIMSLIIFRFISSSADILLSAPLFLKQIFGRN